MGFPASLPPSPQFYRALAHSSVQRIRLYFDREQEQQHSARTDVEGRTSDQGACGGGLGGHVAEALRTAAAA